MTTGAKRVFAIASGKGGVGKTLLSASLSWYFAQRLSNQNKPVIAVDLDLGCGNLNSCLGVRYPQHSVNDFIFRRSQGLQNVISETALRNLHLISCSYRGSEVLDLNEEERKRLLQAVRDLNAGVVLMDLGSGTSVNVLDLFSAADEKIVVTTPESISLHNAYLFLKSAIFRSLWKELDKEAFLAPIKEKLQEIVHQNGVLTMDEIMNRLKNWDRYSSYIVLGLVEELKFKLVVNMRREGPEESYVANFCNLVKKYLYLKGNIEYLGSIEYDEKVRQSIQNLSPFLLDHPHSQAASAIRRIGDRLLSGHFQEPAVH